LSTLVTVRADPNICPNQLVPLDAALATAPLTAPPELDAIPTMDLEIDSSNPALSLSVKNTSIALELYNMGCSAHRFKNVIKCFLRFSHTAPSNASVRAHSPSNSDPLHNGGMTTPGYDSRKRIRSLLSKKAHAYLCRQSRTLSYSDENENHINN
jgi:hypothetical protein